ncbi:hypothetical protein Tco_0591536 [Tanacetum coccineum]
MRECLEEKRAVKAQQEILIKKHAVEEEKESKEVEEDDEVELKNILVVKKDDDIAIDAIPLATKLPMIIKMLKESLREDFEALWRIVKGMYGDTRPEDEFERVMYQVEEYTKGIVHDFEQRLETIFARQVNRVHVLDFAGLTEEMRVTLADRLRMVYTGDEGQELFTSHA